MSSTPVRLLLLADTHVPRRARALPAQVWRAVEAADVVFHAGDWQVPEVLDELQARARRLVGVWGNNDGEELRRRLPETARAEIGRVRGGPWPGATDGHRVPRGRCPHLRPQPHPLGLGGR